MNLNPFSAAARRLAKWLLPHIIDEVQKEVERKYPVVDNDPPADPRSTLPRGLR